MVIQTLINDLSAVIYPKLCLSCYNRLTGHENLLCLPCLTNLPVTNFHKDTENPVSKIFWGRVPLTFASAYLYFSAKGMVQRMIHQLKYKHKKEVGFLLGKLYGVELQKLSILKNLDYLVPVPLHPHKIKKRGYNQSEVIAQGMSESMSVQVYTEGFIRSIHTDTQTKKSKYKRWENVDSIFKIKDKQTFENKHILLIDDVITTGATLESCAQEILKCRNARVSVATIATAMRI